MSNVQCRPLRSSVSMVFIAAVLAGGTVAGQAVAAFTVLTVPGSESTTTNPGTPDVSGDNIVWRARQGSGFGIFGRNLSTNTSYTVTASGTVYNNIAIGGNVVTWEDTRNSAFNIYARVLTAPTEIAVSTGGVNFGKVSPRTDG